MINYRHLWEDFDPNALNCLLMFKNRMNFMQTSEKIYICLVYRYVFATFFVVLRACVIICRRQSVLDVYLFNSVLSE